MKDLIKELFDDKMAVIFSAWSIGLVAMFTMGKDAETILASVLSGLFGIAIGKKL